LINNIPVKASFSYGPNLTISIMKDVIRHHKRPKKLMQVLKNSDDLSFAYQLFTRTPLRSLFQARRFDVKRICFTSDLCVGVEGALKSHFNDLVKAKKFTIQVLDDTSFSQMNPTQVTSLKIDNAVRQDFLLRHVFLGIMQHGDQERSPCFGIAVERWKTGCF